MAPRRTSLLALAAIGVLAALILASAAVAQETTPADVTTVTDGVTAPETTPPVTVTVEDTVTETETSVETSTVEEKTKVELETWGWALAAAGGTAVLILAFALGRRSKPDKRGTGERTPAERNQTLLASLSGWLAEDWVIESQAATEAVVRKGTQRRLLEVDAYGSLSRSELPPVEADPAWTPPRDDPPE